MASATDNQVVYRVREAAKRILGAGRPNWKEALTTDALKRHRGRRGSVKHTAP